jgi:NADPH2:quinone reductase
MRTWHVTQFGEPEQMQLAEAPAPQPQAGEVLVRIHAAALNFFDLLLVQGKYQARPAFPFTAGAECAGTVEEVGEGVRLFQRGDRVAALPSFGCFAEYVTAAEDSVLPVPADLDLAVAAAMPIVYQTSWFGLVDRARLQEGEWLLVHAGASGVGMAAIQIGKALGARVIATAGSGEKLDFARRQGALHAIDYSTSDWVKRVNEITGRGGDVIYDPVGGDVFDQSTKCIAPGGRLLVIGFTSGRIPSIAANRILLKNISIVGAIWGNWRQQNPGYLSDTHAKLLEMFQRRQIAPVVSRQYKFEDLPRGLRDLGNRGAIGKSVLLCR